MDIKSLKELPIIYESKNLKDTDIVLAAITSCTTTSNPYLLIHAALIAKKAFQLGLRVDSKIKTSFTPGSLVVKEYLEQLGLLIYLEELGFSIDGFGCATCYGNSGTLDSKIELEIKSNNLNVCAVISGNRNSQEKIHPLIKSNYIMSPSLVIVYSLIGSIKFDLFDEAIARIDDETIILKDLWPTNGEVNSYLEKLDFSLYKNIYKDIFVGNEFWQNLETQEEDIYKWNENSTYIKAYEFFEEEKIERVEIKNAQILALFGDSISTEQISPNGQISLYSPAAKYLESKGVKSFEYNSFASRRGNCEVMIRGTFDSTNLQNLMLNKEGGFTIDYEENEIVSIYEKSLKAKNKNIPLVIFAGENYGKGVSKDWAVKGTRLLGVKAIIANSFNETHRKNLIELGVLPLEFVDDDINSLKLKGSEIITISSHELKPDDKISATIYKDYFEIED